MEGGIKFIGMNNEGDSSKENHWEDGFLDSCSLRIILRPGSMTLFFINSCSYLHLCGFCSEISLACFFLVVLSY